MNIPVRVELKLEKYFHFGDLERVSVQPGRLMRALDTH